jgi:hypothetical protein
MTSSFERLESWLATKSEVFYVYPAVPTFLMFILSMITAVTLSTGSDDYDDCKGDDDWLWEYLLGQVILYYSFIFAYGNAVFELVPFLRSLSFNFVFFIVFMIANLVWCVVGLVLGANSDCDSNIYFAIAIINMGLFILFFILMFVASLYYFIARRNTEATEMQVSPDSDSSHIKLAPSEGKETPEYVAEVSSKDSDPVIVRKITEQESARALHAEDLKEENLDN